jgi:Leucine-rich repeat (LRR) protein
MCLQKLFSSDLSSFDRPTPLDAQSPGTSQAWPVDGNKDPISRFVAKNLDQLRAEYNALETAEKSWCKEHLKDLTEDESLPASVLEILEPAGGGDKAFQLSQDAIKELRSYVRWEHTLDLWVTDGKGEGKAQREEAVRRIRSCFYNHANSLDLSGLGLKSLPSLKPLESVREVSLFQNTLSEGKAVTEQLPKGARIVHRERTGARGSAKQVIPHAPREAEYAGAFQTRAEKIASKQREDGLWACVDYHPQESGGQYGFSLKSKFTLKDGNIDRPGIENQIDQQFPAVERGPHELLDVFDLSRSSAAKNALASSSNDALEGGVFSRLGFALLIDNPNEVPLNMANCILVVPDIEHLTTCWETLREDYPELDLPELDIVWAAGIAGNMDFVEALMTHDALVSDGPEFMHDMTVHVAQVMGHHLQRRVSFVDAMRELRDQHEDTLGGAQAVTAFYETVIANPTRLAEEGEKLLSGLKNDEKLPEDCLQLLRRIADLHWQLQMRATAVAGPELREGQRFSRAVSQVWGKYVKLRELLKDPKIAQHPVMRTLALHLEVLETAVGAYTDLGSVGKAEILAFDGAYDIHGRFTKEDLWPIYLMQHSKEFEALEARLGKKLDLSDPESLEPTEMVEIEKLKLRLTEAVQAATKAWDNFEVAFQNLSSVHRLEAWNAKVLNPWVKEGQLGEKRAEAAERILKTVKEFEKDPLGRSVSLDLSGLGLSSLPEGLVTITNVTQLNLSKNQLTELPEEVGQPPSRIQDLNVAHNRLKALPKALFESRDLDKLDASQNEIAELSVEGREWSVKKFSDLNLSHNKIVTVSLLCMELKNLDLSHNLLKKWQPWKLKVTECLNLSDNRLEYFDSRDLTKMVKLDLSHQGGQSFKILLDGLFRKNIQSIDLSGTASITVASDHRFGPDSDDEQFGELYLGDGEIELGFAGEQWITFLEEHSEDRKPSTET